VSIKCRSFSTGDEGNVSFIRKESSSPEVCEACIAERVARAAASATAGKTTRPAQRITQRANANYRKRARRHYRVIFPLIFWCFVPSISVEDSATCQPTCKRMQICDVRHQPPQESENVKSREFHERKIEFPRFTKSRKLINKNNVLVAKEG